MQMKYYRDPNDVVWGYDEAQIDMGYPFDPMTQMTDDEVNAHFAATSAELISALKVSVQQWLDTTARASGYDSLASCASYINSSVTQWAADAKAAIAWRDAVWQACFAQWSAAQSATSPVIPTAAALIAELPQPATYGWTAHAAGA